jgi:phosphate transport system protein
MTEFRPAYRRQLDELREHAARMCGLTEVTLADATAALLEANLELARRVIETEAELDRMRAKAEAAALRLLVLQAPVASDLRAVVSALWAVGDLQRMGSLAIHVARTARRRFPAHAVPPVARPIVERMAKIAVHLAGQAEAGLRRPDVEAARQIEDQDDLVDDLQRQLFAELLAPTWTAGVEAAVDTAMLGRFYERFADHAVAVSQRLVFLVTGELAER